MENQQTLDDVVRSSRVIVHDGRYAYLKIYDKNISIGNHFLVSQDADEVTIITEEKNISGVLYEQDTKWFKLIEIQVSMPFVAKGFLAKVTKTIAEQGLNVLVVSTYSKDYFLVREETYESAINALQTAGFSIQQ